MSKERTQWRETVLITAAWPEKRSIINDREDGFKGKASWWSQVTSAETFHIITVVFHSVAHLQFAQGKIQEFDHMMADGVTVWHGRQ